MSRSKPRARAFPVSALSNRPDARALASFPIVFALGHNPYEFGTHQLGALGGSTPR